MVQCFLKHFLFQTRIFWDFPGSPVVKTLYFQGRGTALIPGLGIKMPRTSKVKVRVTQSCPTLRDLTDYTYSPWNSPGQNTGVGSLSLLQGIFPTQGSNPGLPHCRQILYQLSHKGNPRILGWVAYPFSRGSSRPRS